MLPITEITLSSGYKVLVDDDIALKINELLSKRYHSIHWYGSKKKYAVLHIQIPIHHISVGIDNILDGMVVDHKNGNTLDNRRDNLIICTQQQNTLNKTNPRKEYKGVYKLPSGRYQAKISNKMNKLKKHICIGTYDTQKEAALAYNKKAFEINGEYAVLNVIR